MQSAGWVVGDDGDFGWEIGREGMTALEWLDHSDALIMMILMRWVGLVLGRRARIGDVGGGVIPRMPRSFFHTLLYVVILLRPLRRFALASAGHCGRRYVGVLKMSHPHESVDKQPYLRVAWHCPQKP